jgi:hypothetical protein
VFSYEDALGKLANSGFERLRYPALKQSMRLVSNSPAARLYDEVFRLENNKYKFYYSFLEYMAASERSQPAPAPTWSGVHP